jgi:hypothetical protein
VSKALNTLQTRERESKLQWDTHNNACNIGKNVHHPQDFVNAGAYVIINPVHFAEDNWSSLNRDVLSSYKTMG